MPKGKFYEKDVLTMTNTTTLSQEFRSYNKSMAKLGVSGSTLDDLSNSDYTIMLTTKTWHLEHRKSFSKKPQSVKSESITARQYACYISSIGFFRDRVGRDYTPIGYVPTRLTCHSPDRTIKIERSFRIAQDKPPWD